MTSQTFSNKKRFYAFTSAFSLGPVVLSAGVLLLFLLTAVYLPGDIREVQIYAPDILYIFAPTGYSSNFNFLILYMILIFQSVLTSVAMFGFVSNKRASAAYFGLPAKRGNIFLSRYFAGLVLMFVPQIIIFGLMLYGNLVIFGATPVVFNGFLTVFGTSAGLLVTVYSVMAAVTMLVGTKAESVVISLILLFIPLLIMVFANALPSFFTYGSPFGQNYNNSPVAQSNSSYIAAWYWLPVTAVLFFEKYLAPTPSTVPALVNPLPLVSVWILISIAAGYFAYRGFKKFKAENSGAAGTNTPLNNTVAFMVSLNAAILIIFQRIASTNFGAANIAVGAVFSLCVSFIVYIICRFLLTLSLRKAFGLKGMKVYAAVAAVIVLSAAYGLTGGLGYVNYQPKPEEIYTASVTYIGAPDFIVGAGTSFGNFYSFNKNNEEISVRDYYEQMYKSEETETLLAIHKKLIDAGAGLFDSENEQTKIQIAVEYYLKNGKQIGRFYKTVPSKLIREILAAQEETASIKNKISGATVLSKEFYTENIDAESFTLTDGLFNNVKTVAAEHKLALLDALQKDIDSLSFEEKYYPSGPTRAVLCMPRVERTEGGKLIEPNMSMMSFVISSSLNQTTTVTTNRFINFLTGQFTEALRFYITDGYVNTLNYLRANNICEWLDGESDISELTGLRFARYSLFPNYMTQSLYFRSYSVFSSEGPMSQQTPSGVTMILTESNEDEIYGNAKEIPADKYAELLPLARTHYFMDEGGYLLYAQTKEQTGTKRVTLFLPEDDAPDWFKAMNP